MICSSLGFVECVVLLDCGVDLECEFLVDFESDFSAVHEETDKEHNEENQTDQEDSCVIFIVNLLLNRFTLRFEIAVDVIVILNACVFLAQFDLILMFNALADELFSRFLHFQVTSEDVSVDEKSREELDTPLLL